MTLPDKPKPYGKELPEAIYLKDLSTDCLEVMQHFGPEAASLLNNYCCALEDALIEQVKMKMIQQEEIQRLQAILQEHNINYDKKPTDPGTRTD